MNTAVLLILLAAPQFRIEGEVVSPSKRIDPASFTLPGLFIAEIRALRGDFDGAIVEYREFLKTHPGHPEARSAELQLRRLEKVAQ